MLLEREPYHTRKEKANAERRKIREDLLKDLLNGWPRAVRSSQFFGFVFAARAITEDGEGDHYDHRHKNNHDGELDERQKEGGSDD